MNLFKLLAELLIKLTSPTDYRDDAIGDLNESYYKKRQSESEFAVSLYIIKTAFVSGIHFSFLRLNRAIQNGQAIIRLLMCFWIIALAFFASFMQWLSNLDVTNKVDILALNNVVAGKFNLIVTDGAFWHSVGNNLVQGKSILCLIDVNGAIISLLTLLGAVLVLKFTHSKQVALTSISILFLLPFITGTIFLNLNEMTLDNIGSILTPMLLSTFYSSIAFIGLTFLNNSRTRYA